MKKEQGLKNQPDTFEKNELAEKYVELKLQRNLELYNQTHPNKPKMIISYDLWVMIKIFIDNYQENVPGLWKKIMEVK